MSKHPTFNVQVVSPEKIIFDSDATMVVCRIAEGEAAFLPGHEPLMSLLQPGKVRVLHEDGEEEFEVEGGFIQVTGNSVKIMA